jgi:branched-chain amino acid transport system permease protein
VSPRARALVGASVLIGALLVIVLLVQTLAGASQQRILLNFMISLVAVVGIGIFVGNTGILSFGHVTFMGLGAYLGSLLTMSPVIKASVLPQLPGWLSEIELGLLPALAVTMVSVGFVAFLIGLVICRLSGSGAAIATLGWLIIVHVVLIGAVDFTRGSQTFYGVPGNINAYVAAGAAVLTILLAKVFRETSVGLQLRAAREDEHAARSMGVDVFRTRLVAWTFSAMVVAASGVMLAQSLRAFSPREFYLVQTFALLAMLIVGGINTVTGAVAGTALITLLTEILRRLQEGPIILGIDLPQVYGLTQIGIALAILAVLYWRREGLFPFELDEMVLQSRSGGGGPRVDPPDRTPATRGKTTA